jgi:hypothetical protein
LRAIFGTPLGWVTFVQEGQVVRGQSLLRVVLMGAKHKDFQGARVLWRTAGPQAPGADLDDDAARAARSIAREFGVEVLGGSQVWMRPSATLPMRALMQEAGMHPRLLAALLTRFPGSQVATGGYVIDLERML